MFRDMTPLRFRRIEPAFRISVEKRAISVRPSNDLLKRLGWVRGDKIGLSIGEGEDAGFAMLSKNDGGWMIRPSSSSEMQLLFSRKIGGTDLFPGLPEKMRSTMTAFEVLDGAIRFALPWHVAEHGLGERETTKTTRLDDVVQDAALPAPRHPAPPWGGSEKNVGDRPSDLWPPHILTLAQGMREKGSTFEVIAAALGPGYTKNAVIGKLGREEKKALIGRMSEAQAEEFVQAVARDKPKAELVAILARSPGKYARGSFDYWKNRLISRIDDARNALAPAPDPVPNRAARAAAAELPHPRAGAEPAGDIDRRVGGLPASVPVAPSDGRTAGSIPATGATRPAPPWGYAPAGADVPQPISAAVLEQLRTKAMPVLQRAGYTVTKSPDGSAVLVDKQPLTPIAVFALANKHLADDRLDPIVLETTT